MCQRIKTRPIVRGSVHLSWRSRTIEVVDVSIASLTGTLAPPVVPRVGAAAPAVPHPAPVASDAVNAARMNAVVDLIASLTGRQVKLVPPSAYLVSAPSGSHLFAPVELLAPIGLANDLQQSSGPLEIDITSVLRTGTAERMLLDQKPTGNLQLRAAVDVEI